MTIQNDVNGYLKPGFYIDSDSPEVIEFVRNILQKVKSKGDLAREAAEDK
jgi:hypothetical protein